MRRPLVVLLLTCCLLAPGVARARVDATCSDTQFNSLSGKVANAAGTLVDGLKVGLYTTNSRDENLTKNYTDVTQFGGYFFCVPHNTYDVYVRDQRPSPLYADETLPYTSFTDQGDLDFTPQSKHPVLYRLVLTTMPQAIASGSITWTVLSKMPHTATSKVLISLGHIPGQEFEMTYDAAGSTSPSSGGWNRWTYTATFPPNMTEGYYLSKVRALDLPNSPADGVVEVAQRGGDFYVIDRQAPILGSANSTQCGPGISTAPFSPQAGTTNPRPLVSIGICDRYTPGGVSGLDRYSAGGKICSDAALTTGCSPIYPDVDEAKKLVTWSPATPLALGTYYLQFSVADRAGNVMANPQGYQLVVTDRGGQVPFFSVPQPGNVGSGNSMGIVFGSARTTPPSVPSIGVNATDGDGQLDLQTRTLKVRIYYGDEATLVYQYDPDVASTYYDRVSKRGGGTFTNNADLVSATFRATGFDLELSKGNAPPGRYIATATIGDRGGNSADIAWHWIFVVSE